MKLIKTCSLATVLCGAFYLAMPGSAEVKPNALFSDHAVLQSGMPVPVWGTADPGEKVAVTFEGKTTTATAGANGK